MTSEAVGFDSEGREITADVLARMAQNAWFENGDDLPTPTTDFRALAGSPSNPGRWFRVTGIYGPKDLGNGKVVALELTDQNDLSEVVFCGSSQIEPRFENETVRHFVEANGPLYFRYVYHPEDTERKKRQFYTCEARFGGSWPS